MVESERKQPIFPDNPRHRQKRLKFFGTTTRTATWSTTTMRSRKRFMQIEVDNVDAHVARAGNPHQGVHVCSIHVHEPAGLVDDSANLLNVLLKKTKRVWVCQH